MATSSDLDHPLYEEARNRRAHGMSGDLLRGHHPLDLQQDGLRSLHHQPVDKMRSAEDRVATRIRHGGMDERYVGEQWCTDEHLAAGEGIRGHRVALLVHLRDVRGLQTCR